MGGGNGLWHFLSPSIWYPDGTTWGVDLALNRGIFNGASSTSTAIFTLTRSTVSNASNSAGVYSQFAANVPALTDLGLQVEASRTNYVQQSRDLTQAAKWTLVGCTVLRNQVGIDGVSSTACLVTVTAPNATITQNITDTSRARWVSVFTAQKGNGGGNNQGTMSISMDGGATVNSCSGVSGGAITRTVNTVTQVLTNPVCQLKFTTVGDTWLVDCVQIENSATNASSPMYTANTIFVRGADSAVANASFNPSSGAIVAQWRDIGPIGVQHIICQLNTDASNFNRMDVTTGNNAHITDRTAAATVADFTGSGTVVAGTAYNAAMRWNTNDFAGAFSDTLDSPNWNPQKDLSGATPTGTATLYIGVSSVGTAQMQGFVQKLFFLPASAVTDATLVSLAGGSVTSPISFSNNETFTPPAGLSWPASINGFTIPQSVYWSTAANGFKMTGFSSVSRFVSAGIFSCGPYYIDSSKPDNSGNGLTQDTAVRDGWYAAGLANADGQACSLFLFKGGLEYYQQNSMNGPAGGVEPTKPFGVGDYGTGRATMLNSVLWVSSATKDPTFTNCYVWNIGSGSTVRVFDRLTLDDKGLWTEITVQASQAAVNAASSGWFIDGSFNLTLQRADGARPTLANTFISGNFDTWVFTANQYDNYFGGIDFCGGVNGALAVVPASGTPAKNVSEDTCTHRYSGNGSNNIGAVRVSSFAGFWITNNCDASKGQSDGFNPHSITAMMHLNPTGWYNGSAANVSCNYITAHESIISWIAGGSGGRSYDGPEHAYIDSTKTYVLGNYSETSAGSTGATISCSSSTGGALGWVERSTVKSQGDAWRASGAGTIIALRSDKAIAGATSTASGGIVTTF